jgi:UDP-glucose 4-epimerase
MKAFETLHGARALVTGGAGLIGSHLADLLASAGASEIVVLDNLSRGRLDNLATARASGRVTLVDGDIRDRGLLARALDGVDVLFHLAAIRITQCAEEPRLALEVLVDGTFNVLEAAVAAGVKKVVAASSASIYGMAERFPTSEDHHPYNNRTLYGAAKAFNEGLLASLSDMYGLNYVALRYFNVFGPRMDTHGAYTEVLIRWMDRIDRGLSPVIYGDGKQTMDFVYVEDVARANALAATSGATNEVFNVASGVETSLDELAQALLTAMGASLAVEYGPERKVNAVSRRLADPGRARARLGFETRVDLDEGLRRLVVWWRSQSGRPALSTAGEGRRRE